MQNSHFVLRRSKCSSSCPCGVGNFSSGLLIAWECPVMRVSCIPRSKLCSCMEARIKITVPWKFNNNKLLSSVSCIQSPPVFMRGILLNRPCRALQGQSSVGGSRPGSRSQPRVGPNYDGNLDDVDDEGARGSPDEARLKSRAGEIMSLRTWVSDIHILVIALYIVRLKRRSVEIMSLSIWLFDIHILVIAPYIVRLKSRSVEIMTLRTKVFVTHMLVALKNCEAIGFKFDHEPFNMRVCPVHASHCAELLQSIQNLTHAWIWRWVHARDTQFRLCTDVSQSD